MPGDTILLDVKARRRRKNDGLTVAELLARALDEVIPVEDEFKRGVERAARAHPDTEWQEVPRDWPQHWDRDIGTMRPCGRSLRWRGNICFVVCEIWPHGFTRSAGWIAGDGRIIYSRGIQWVFGTEAEARDVADDVIVLS
jgi:hypothetical protein